MSSSGMSPYGSCKNSRFRGTYRLISSMKTINEIRIRPDPEHRFLQEPYGDTSQKTTFFTEGKLSFSYNAEFYSLSGLNSIIVGHLNTV
jgi:hypothetical protein